MQIFNCEITVFNLRLSDTIGYSEGNRPDGDREIHLQVFSRLFQLHAHLEKLVIIGAKKMEHSKYMISSP